MKNFVLVFAFLLCSLPGLLSAQTGTLRGTVIDDADGLTIIGSTVLVEGSSNGTTTDLDGNYSLKLAPGTYTIVFSSISYATQKISDVVVKDGEVTLLNIRLKSSTEEINEVVISATKIENTENALLTIQRKSTTVLDGISSESITKTGDSDAAAALRRVPGVSVEGGKYIYVRGLGDRYTKTIFNGMEIPGLDPDRNTVQMDIFPTTLVDNLIVYKSFSPELPGDFTGGVVDISTKSFPDTEVFQVGASFTYNTVTTFNPDFILYEGGKLDGLGFDDGTRKLPFSYDTEITKGLEVTGNPKLTEYTKAFGKVLDATQQNNFLDQSYNISYGNQYNKNGRSYGFFTGATYQNTYQFYEKAQYGEYQHDGNRSVTELDGEEYRTSEGPLGQHDVLWSILAGGAYKKATSKYTLQLFHTQNGQSSASSRYIYDGFDNHELVSDILTYTQRNITNVLVSGKHKLNKLEMEWKNSFTNSGIKDPDMRIMTFVVNGADTVLEGGGSATSLRLFRKLNEKTENLRVDFTLPFKQWGGLESKVKFGLYNVFKMREFDTFSAVLNNPGEVITEGAGQLLQEDNIWTPQNTDGTYVTGQRDPSNTYQSMMNTLAFYVMNELPVTPLFSITYGLRVEKADIFFTGQRFGSSNVIGVDKFQNHSVLSEFNALPSVNMIYKVMEKMNVRLSYSRTVARPTFKEKSLASILDPITETRFLGNLDLKQTDIDNVDLRWEYFFGSGEMISVSGFFKNFKNPIEIVPYADEAPRDLTPKNVDNAKAYGVEFEFRKNFKFIHEKLEGLVIGANVSYIKSVTKMSDEEIIGRTKWLRDGETLDETRAMFGQSPYIVNANLNYTSEKIGLTVTVAYNVQGKRLAVVGPGRAPDVYEMPFHSLNLKVTENFGKKDQFSLSLTAGNLLNDDLVRQYETTYGATPQIFQRLVPGRSFKLGFAYRLR